MIGVRLPLPKQSLDLIATGMMVTVCTTGTTGAVHAVNLDSAPIRWEAAIQNSGAAKAPLELDDGTILGNFSNPVDGGKGIICMKSTDAGRSWKRLAVIARDEDPRADIGDGNFVQLADGTVLHTYRHNRYQGRPESQRTFSIQVAISRDRGASWRHHSTVIRDGGTEDGFWAPAHFVTRTGTIQCYYDDEITPAREGFPGHQWAMMKSWDPRSSRWSDPVVVSRARDSDHLSRDGMCSVVELPGGRLICALESCSTAEPISGVIRFVISDNGGKSWSWQKTERFILYETRDRRYNAIAPWLTRLADGTLLCVFVTDEDQTQPDDVSTGVRNEHLKYVLSRDEGRSWTRSYPLVNDHVVYLPGVIQIRQGSERGKILCCYVNDRTHALCARLGTLVIEPDPEDPAPDGTAREGAAAFVQIILGDPCGGDDGRKVSIRNTHDSRTIRARVRKHWTVRGEARTRETTIVIRPGEDQTRELGCSAKRVKGGIRTFKWTIVSAEFH